MFKNMAPAEIGGWIGMALIHSNTMPTLLAVIFGYAAIMPPLSMVLLTWSGLGLFLWRAVYQRDVLYMVSNGIGFSLNSILLAIIVFPWS